MIKIFKAALLFVISFHLQAAGQSEPESDSLALKPVRSPSPQRVRSLTKTNPFAVFWGPIPLTSEFKILQEWTTHPYQSVQVGFSLLRKSPIVSLFEDTLTGSNDHYVIRGWRFQLAKRYYMHGTGLAPQGIYISPSFSYSTAKISTELALRSGYFLKATHYNASLLTGAQIVVFDTFCFDMFTGLGIQDKIWTEHDTNRNFVRSIPLSELGMIDWQVKFTLGFSVGLAF